MSKLPAAAGRGGKARNGDATRPLPSVSATYPLSPQERRARAFADLKQGARAFGIWGIPPLVEAGRSFRRTIVGPVLPTLNRGLNILVLGLLFGTLLDLRAARYVPHLVAGMVVWLLIQGIFRDACRAFSGAEDLLNGTLPVSIAIFRSVWRAFITFGFNLALIAPVAVALGFLPGWEALLAIPGLLLMFLNGLWVSLVLAPLCLQFDFLRMFVQRALRFAFLGTPILWIPQQLPNRQILVQSNPFYHCLEVVRGPLIGQSPGLTTWTIVAGLALAGWLVAILVFARYRARVAFLA